MERWSFVRIKSIHFIISILFKSVFYVMSWMAIKAMPEEILWGRYFFLFVCCYQRSLVHCSPWGCEESDTTEWLHFHSWLSCVGEGNGNPLQCSCLENPRDGGAWWAAVYGVAQGWTRLKWLSSSSSSIMSITLNYFSIDMTVYMCECVCVYNKHVWVCMNSKQLLRGCQLP